MHFPLYVLVCCVWVQIMYKFAAHAAVAPVCSAVKQLYGVEFVEYSIYLLLLKKCGPSGRRRRSVLMRG